MTRSWLVGVGILLAGGQAAAVELHGFVEGAYGVRLPESPVHDTGSYTLEEVRAQLRAQAIGDAGEAFVRLDFVRDPLDTEEGVEIRESFARFSTFGDHLDIKVGRQILTWGTGDLVFISDLFPKDWESFFIGRDDQYLKAPSDAVRLGFFGLPFDTEVVLTPRFSGDCTPEPGGRFSIPAPPPNASSPREPAAKLENAEVAVRLSRYLGDVTAAVYGYRGFFPTPRGSKLENGDPVRFHPQLRMIAGSLRGALAGGIAWAETGYYDSSEDDPAATVPSSSLRYLAGWERELVSDLNVTVQYFGEHFDNAPSEDDLDHLVTIRLEKFLYYQTVRLSCFAYHDPADGDSYVRALGSYDVTDNVKFVLGTNVFRGLSRTQFGAFDSDDNLYARVRFSF